MIARAKKLTCSTVGCKGAVRGRCQMPLQGPLEGKKCDRPLCVGCTHNDNPSAERYCKAHKSGKVWIW